MPKILEKIKNFFSGKFVYKVKKPVQPTGEQESKPQEEPKSEEKPEEQK